MPSTIFINSLKVMNEVTTLFKSIEKGTTDIKCNYLAENFEYYDQEVVNMIKKLSSMSSTNLFNTFNSCLMIIKTSLYGYQFYSTALDKFKVQNKMYQKESLHGFVLCLKQQKKTPKMAHKTLMKVTNGEEHMTLEEVKDFYARVPEYFVKERQDAVFTYPHIMTRIVDFADVSTRRMLAQTNRKFNHLTRTRPFHIENLHIIYKWGHVRVRVNSETLKATQDIKGDGRKVLYRLLQNNGDVWMDCKPKRESPLKKEINWLFTRSNLTIKNLYFEVAPPTETHPEREVRFGDIKINVENLFTNSRDEVYNWIKEDSIKKIVHLDNEFNDSILDLSGNAQTLITTASINLNEIPHPLLQFKFVMVETDELTYQKLMDLKNYFLQNSPDLREFRMKCALSDEDYDQININLGTFNSRDSINPKWASYKYPNQPSKKLQLCVVGEVVWFKGPGYVPGELERAEEELRARFGDNERKTFTRNQTIGLLEEKEVPVVNDATDEQPFKRIRMSKMNNC